MIEILNPTNPVSEKLELFVRTYMNTCFVEKDKQVIIDRFTNVVELLEVLVKRQSGSEMGTWIKMLAVMSATKFRPQANSVISGLIFVEELLRKKLNGVDAAERKPFWRRG